MLEIKSLSNEIFAPLSLRVKRGEIVAIHGASGSGKSVFLRAIVDLDPNEGEVFLDGVERSNMPANIWRSKVAMIPAQTGWWADEVAEHFEKTNQLDELLKALDLPSNILTWLVSRLSTGERHRLGIARAINLKPQVLLLDEPTAALDKKATILVEDLVNMQAKNGVAIVLVTHDEDQAKRLANRSFLLKNGEFHSLKGGVDNG